MEDDPSRPRSVFPCPQITDEAFNLFHSIDRELYTRLITNLGRDPAESVQVMAFWMWLEREANDMNLIKRMLTLPPALVNELADETGTCLKSVESDVFLYGNGNEITLLPSLLSSPVVSLRFFHDNRIAVLRGVSKIVNTVCSRAFGDILQRAWREQAAAIHKVAADGGFPVQFMGNGAIREVGESSREAEKRVEGGGGVVGPPPILQMLYNPHHLNVPYVPLPTGMQPPPLNVVSPGVHRAPPPLVADGLGFPFQMLAAPYDLVAQRQMLSNELGEMLTRNLSINHREETANAVVGNEGEEVQPDDRTIFLTFSKGYPITEDEVREFFTRYIYPKLNI